MKNHNMTKTPDGRIRRVLNDSDCVQALLRAGAKLDPRSPNEVDLSSCKYLGNTLLGYIDYLKAYSHRYRVRMNKYRGNDEIRTSLDFILDKAKKIFENNHPFVRALENSTADITKSFEKELIVSLLLWERRKRTGKFVVPSWNYNSPLNSFKQYILKV